MMRLVLAMALVVSINGAAHAQQAGGTPEDQRACNASVKRYCSSVVQGGDFAILGCLQQNRSRISTACQRMLVKYGQ